MSLTIHLNTLMITGLLMLPGAFAVFYVLGIILTALGGELGAMAFAGVTATAIFVFGIALFLIGVGQEIG